MMGPVPTPDETADSGLEAATPPPGRFLQLPQVAEVLNTSMSQVYALVRGKHLRAMKLGGRGQWRVSVADLEAFIAEQYAATERWIDTHPYSAGADDDTDDEEPTP